MDYPCDWLSIDHMSKYTQDKRDNPPSYYKYALMGIPSKVFVEMSKKLTKQVSKQATEETSEFFTFNFWRLNTFFQIWDAYDVFFYANTRGYWTATEK